MTCLPDLPAEAAFAALRPTAPRLIPAGAEEADRLRITLALSADTPVFQLWGEGRTLPGKHVVGGGCEALFIRFVPAEALDRHHLAQALSDGLAAQGLPVCPPVPGFPRPDPAGGGWFASPYRPHRYAHADATDLERLGNALARLHAALTVSPLRSVIAGRTAARYATLQDMATRCRSNTPTGVPAAVTDWLCHRELRFDSGLLTGRDTQALHGDLNYSNVCFSLEDGLPWFVDFETATLSHLSPACDLAMVMDRFIDTGPPDTAGHLWDAFAKAYGNTPDQAYLRQIIAQLALRSLLLLCQRHAQGQAVPAAEWAKFTQALARVQP